MIDQHLGLLLLKLAKGHTCSPQEALSLADCRSMEEFANLKRVAVELRDRGFGRRISYSRKVFIPLTQLCRDVCHYCSFAKTPTQVNAPYMRIEEVLAVARAGAAQHCKEALFTLGERPELRYEAARRQLDELGFASTLDYLAYVARTVFDETGLLPHINAGCMSAEEMCMLRRVSASMGLMLESSAIRLCGKGMPHYGSPDKEPAFRLATIARAGVQHVPMTSGLLIGIGETRSERIESLLALRELHSQYGHIQEIILQNFRAKPDTLMALHTEPDFNELSWTVAVARLIFGANMSIQAPPNLSPSSLLELVHAGINDWGGISPVTHDFVNPEAPWPQLEILARETQRAGKLLCERLTLYPNYAIQPALWVDPALQPAVLRATDSLGYPRGDEWAPGSGLAPPAVDLALLRQVSALHDVSPNISAIIAATLRGVPLDEAAIVRLFAARDADFSHICESADTLRRQVNGDVVTYVVNRNINYTNVCYFKCKFCAFSKRKPNAEDGESWYDLAPAEIARRACEAWQRGATEVCMQGGIHPDYTGQTYLDIVRAVRDAVPGMHIHAFSPLEIWQGAQTLGLPLRDYLLQLRAAGLGSLPGTAAEILDDEVRAKLCPDKINTEQWLEVMRIAHEIGLPSTATIMFGHIDRTEHWARHLLRIRALAAQTGLVTEFVPLPFVPMEAPMYRKGQARMGPTFRETLLMHAVARLVLHPHVKSIQASWVKLGPVGVQAVLSAGANDLGGTLMNESITRAAGSVHGQEFGPLVLDKLIIAAGRIPAQRSTLYGPVTTERIMASHVAAPLTPITNRPASPMMPRSRDSLRIVSTDKSSRLVRLDDASPATS